LGRDLWKEMIAVVEAETWGTAPAADEPSDEEPQIDEVGPEDDLDTSEPGRPEVSVLPETRHRRWATPWDEDAT
jgi:hypothetical protein